MADNKELKKRRMRVVDFVADSLHEIARHSPSPGAEQLHKTADAVRALNDQKMVIISEVE